MFILIKSKACGGATTDAIKMSREKSKVLFISSEDGVNEIIHNLYTTPESRYNNTPKIDKIITHSKKLVKETLKNNLFDDTKYDNIIIDDFSSLFTTSNKLDEWIEKFEVFTERNTNKNIILVERLRLEVKLDPNN